MRRRLTLAIVGVVAGALALAGLGSLLLAGHAMANDTRSDLVRQADELRAGVTEIARPGVLTLVQRVARLEGASIVRVGTDGAITGPLPAGVTPAMAHPLVLLGGATVSGVRHGLAYAAVPVVIQPSQLAARRRTLGQPVTAAIVLTRRVPGVPGGGAYFAVTAALILLIAAVVAERLGRRITRPLAQVEENASRIAGGDLSGKVEVSQADYPELVSLAESINTMTDSLSRSRGLERQFLMSVSHDLRTPLTSIRGWAEAIADGAAVSDRRAAEVIGAEARRLERLVQDLLDLAKLDARSFSLALRPTDVAEVLTDTAESFRPAAADAGLSLTVHADGDARLVARADPDRLAQVVANLVENAYKFASHRMAVTARSRGDWVVVAVEDDGPGVTAEDLPRLFDRLYQSGRSPARQGGSGLGLTIVKELVAAMGGDVAVESPTSDGRGTRIVVRLPAAGSD
ncbi:MAG TPA: HAMP domain-containing sensor histidine kinase [Acidimicrobiales bacterium]|nr:HAMP domain-containing sensor histidine kinase [Acidimicrobiales bacterium]